MTTTRQPADTYMDTSRLPLPFCPGCGHSHILPALDRALQRLDVDPARVVLVSDIGCAGLSDQYFVTSALHGLHGRSFTYATGLKLANPELTVIVLVGDGGCGIGGNHLLHAARRNVGITVLVFNNFNFGMTGGQHSPTTPSDARTTTTPAGHLEAPLDICGTVAPSRPGLVARSHTFDPELDDLVARAIATEGFALVDIWELCTAYFGPRNRLSRKALLETMKATGMPTGILVQGDRPEYARQLRRRALGSGPASMGGRATAGHGRDARDHRDRDARGGSGRDDRDSEGGRDADEEWPGAFVARFPRSLKQPVSLLIAGDAGQRIQSTAEIVGLAAVASDLYATKKGAYPVTVQTGYSLADLIVDAEPIGCTQAGVPDLAVVTGAAGLVRARPRLRAMSADGLVIADEGLAELETEARVLRLPLTARARDIDRRAGAAVGIGALLGATGILDLGALAWAADHRLGRDNGPKVAAAARAGVELAAGLPGGAAADGAMPPPASSTAADRPGEAGSGSATTEG